MKAEELNKIINLHKMWIEGIEDGRKAALKKKDLSEADLRWATLREADLRGATLSEADLRWADLRWADLREADLSGADLSGADLSGADLSGADLSGAALSFATLSWATLRWATLREADLREADLRWANLLEANLKEARNVPYIPMFLPEEEFIGWKKVKDFIIKLKILEDSKRSRATTEKCRCDKALVLSIENLDGTKADIDEIVNDNYIRTKYRVGEIVCADKWDDDRWVECSHGIHFFVDRQSAVIYY